MRLTLSTLRCPDSVAPETRHVGGGEFTLGRAPDCSWVLADPDRHLSKRHCVVAFRNGLWQIADLSTNGTYLNREASPIGQGQVRDLQDGDRIRLGAYEIELRIEEDAISPAPHPGLGHGGVNPFDDDPFAAPQPAPVGVPSSAPVTAWRPEGPMLPADFDPLGPADRDPFTGPSVADHSPSVSDAFRPPAATAGPPASGGLPDDWDLDEPLIPPAAQPVATPQAFAPPPPQTAYAPPPPAAPPQTAYAPPPPPPVAPPQQVYAPPPPVTPPQQAYAPPPVAPPPPHEAVAPPPVPRDTPFRDPTSMGTPSPFGTPEPMPQAPLTPPPVPPPPTPPPVTQSMPQAAPIGDGAALAAFLRGAGMPDARMDNPLATMEELGRAFRHIVSGLRAVLIARASIKGEFRIEQTMIRAKGNNPLKFSADDDDALNAFFGTGRRTSMGPAEAVSEALRDITLHELAVVSAMQAATREVLKWLSPEEAMSSASGGLLPMQKKANAFDVYADTHQALLAALSDDFERVYGKAFARAYEDALKDAARQKPETR